MDRRSFVKGLPTISLLGAAAPHAEPSPAPQATDIGPPPRGGTWFDLSRVQPADALSSVPRRGRWRAVPWKGRSGDDALQGTMLIIGPETNPPMITLDPLLKGPHEIYIGVSQFMEPSQIKVKLDNDPGYVTLQNEITEKNSNESHTRHVIQDCYFRTTDMTGRRIQIAQQKLGDAPAPAMIGYVRAVPVSPATLDQKKGKKRLVAMNDGHGIFYEGVSTEQDLWDVFVPYRDSGFSAMLFCITGADHCNYPTKIGTLIGEGLDDFPSPGYRRYTDSVKAFLDRGADPLASALRMAHAVGLEFHISVRMEAFAMEPPFDGAFMSRFYAGHPQLRCIDSDGRRIARLSYAFPEVREHMFAIIDELVHYVPEGINLIFPRAQPFVLYEEPFLKEFRGRYGKDPRSLPFDHPDAIALRSDFMNSFMREVRRRTRRASGRSPEISAIVLSDRRSNELYGLDVMRWVGERWVDEISPSVWDWRRWRVKPEAEYLAGACRKAGCRLVVNLHPSELRYEQWLPAAFEYHQRGADGFSIWDTDPRQPTQWGLVRALAHADEWQSGASGPPTAPSVVTLTELGDFVMDRYKSSWCF